MDWLLLIAPYRLSFGPAALTVLSWHKELGLSIYEKNIIMGRFLRITSLVKYIQIGADYSCFASKQLHEIMIAGIKTYKF